MYLAQNAIYTLLYLKKMVANKIKNQHMRSLKFSVLMALT